MKEFQNFEGQNIFEENVKENNFRKIFKHIKTNLQINKFQNVINYTGFQTFYDLGQNISNQLDKTLVIITEENVADLRNKIDTFFYRVELLLKK